MTDEITDQGAQAEDVAGEVVEPAALTELEQAAVEMGWKPQAEYAGPAERWKPAKEFILAERELNRGFKREMRGLREQVERMASASTRQTERALKEQAETLQAQFNDAVANKDVQAANKAAHAMRELERDAQNAAPTRSVETDFATRNPWYGKDDEATAYAVSISQLAAKQGKSHADQIEAVEDAMRKRFPELMGAVAQKPPAAVNTPNRPATRTRAKGYDDLPKDAKSAADDYAALFKRRHGKDEAESKAAYAKDYWSEQAA